MTKTTAKLVKTIATVCAAGLVVAGAAALMRQTLPVSPIRALILLLLQKANLPSPITTVR